MLIGSYNKKLCKWTDLMDLLQPYSVFYVCSAPRRILRTASRNFLIGQDPYLRGTDTYRTCSCASCSVTCVSTISRRENEPQALGFILLTKL